MNECEYLKERRPLTTKKIFYCLKYHYYVDYETYRKYCTKHHMCKYCRDPRSDQHIPSSDH